LRRRLKGKTFTRLAEKMRLVENTLRRWRAHPAFIRRLCGWEWIRDAIHAIGRKERRAG